MGNADGIFVAGDSQSTSGESLNEAGDTCTVEGAGTYAIVAYIGESRDEAEIMTQLHSFEIEG